MYLYAVPPFMLLGKPCLKATAGFMSRGPGPGPWPTDDAIGSQELRVRIDVKP